MTNSTKTNRAKYLYCNTFFFNSFPSLTPQKDRFLWINLISIKEKYVWVNFRIKNSINSRIGNLIVVLYFTMVINSFNISSNMGQLSLMVIGSSWLRFSQMERLWKLRSKTYSEKPRNVTRNQEIEEKSSLLIVEHLILTLTYQLH